MEINYHHPRVQLVYEEEPIKAESVEELDHGYLKVHVIEDDEKWGDHEEIIVGPGGVIRIWEGDHTRR